MIKTYVLLECMDADAPVYQTTPEGQRTQVKKIPFHRPTLRQPFYSKDGINRVIRYKSNAVDADGKSVIDQREQIDKLKIEANVPFSQQEYKDLVFKHGVLTTGKRIAQDYLEAHPEFFGFEGTCDDVRDPKYKILDEAGEAKIKLADSLKRVKAANKIADLDLAQAQAKMIQLNGSAFETPDNLEDCQLALLAWVDDANDEGLEAMLSSETSADDDVKILVGKLLNAKMLSFTEAEGKVCKKDRQGKWTPIKDISSSYEYEERANLFNEFLLTSEGKALRSDLENDLAAYEKGEVTGSKAGRPKKQ